MSTLFQPGTIPFKVGLFVSTIALAFSTIGHLGSAFTNFSNGSIVMGLLLLILAALLGFGTFFIGKIFYDDMQRGTVAYY